MFKKVKKDIFIYLIQHLSQLIIILVMELQSLLLKIIQLMNLVPQAHPSEFAYLFFLNLFFYLHF